MTALRTLRWLGALEGLAYLALLFIAMPLKHLLEMPEAVRVVGTVHGVLFLAFVVALFRTSLELRWPPSRWGAALLASLLPFGTFVFNRSLRRLDRRERE